jgi:hypothetical protein
MKFLTYPFLVSIVAGLIACQSTTKNFGEPFTPKDPVTVDALLKQVSIAGHLSDIQVEGKVVKSCMTEGCWFTLANGSGDEVLFTVKDKKFRVPVNSPGESVIVLADAVQDTSAAGKALLSVKGMRFK